MKVKYTGVVDIKGNRKEEKTQVTDPKLVAQLVKQQEQKKAEEAAALAAKAQKVG